MTRILNILSVIYNFWCTNVPFVNQESLKYRTKGPVYMGNSGIGVVRYSNTLPAVSFNGRPLCGALLLFGYCTGAKVSNALTQIFIS